MGLTDTRDNIFYTIMIIKIFKHAASFRVTRYLFSGGVAATTDLGLLFALVHIFHIRYLLSAMVAFVFALAVSFILQKFVTFDERSKERIPAQITIYFCVALLNLGLNTLFMYVGVEKIHLHYLLAQFLANGIIAFYSFFVYRHLVFQRRNF